MNNKEKQAMDREEHERAWREKRKSVDDENILILENKMIAIYDSYTEVL